MEVQTGFFLNKLFYEPRVKGMNKEHRAGRKNLAVQTQFNVAFLVQDAVEDRLNKNCYCKFF